MRAQMASMDSTLSSYDAKLKDLSATIGDTIHGNTEIQDSVQGFADRIKNFSVSCVEFRVSGGKGGGGGGRGADQEWTSCT